MHLTINNQDVIAQTGMTILEVARQNGIYIPTLCAHKHLTPFGACRMCIVEIEGVRGFQTSCTTPAADGMIIQTDSEAIHLARKHILQLMMSKHPSACLVCDNRQVCRDCMETIRKAGVTTGCSTCPKNGQCEFQEVIYRLDIGEALYPTYYRFLAVEKYDPFYDRDYNLCILCGRCVQVCNEVRLADVLSFVHRGTDAVIGTAFGRTHVDAGCEFCGACVTICPTGALAEKVNKWEGIPESEVVTTCPFCGIGCQIRLLIKRDEVIGSLPVDDPLVSDGQLCVKGRFSVTETVTNPYRLVTPYRIEDGIKDELSWEEMISQAAERLSACAPSDFAMLISPNSTCEDLYIAAKFSRLAMRSNRIDTSARLFYGKGYHAYLKLMDKTLPLAELQHAKAILAIGLDARYGRSVLGVEIKKALKAGAKLAVIHPDETNLDIVADYLIHPQRGSELATLKQLAELTAGDTSATLTVADRTSVFGELNEIAAWLKNSPRLAILVGSEFLHYSDSPQILATINHIAENTSAGVLPLPVYNNLIGAMLMGTEAGFLPGGVLSSQKSRHAVEQIWGDKLPTVDSDWNIERLFGNEAIKTLYLIGEVPTAQRPPADFLIYQNMFPPPSTYLPDLTLPMAAFSEVDGTFINAEGRVQPVRKAVNPRGQALPTWEILCRIARQMGIAGFDFDDVAAIQAEIATLLKTFETSQRQTIPLHFLGAVESSHTEVNGGVKTSQDYPLMLALSLTEHTYMGYPLSTWVPGLRELLLEGNLIIHPTDAREIGVVSGEQVIVTAHDFEWRLPIQVRERGTPGTLHLSLNSGEKITSNPLVVKIRKQHV